MKWLASDAKKYVIGLPPHLEAMWASIVNIVETNGYNRDIKDEAPIYATQEAKKAQKAEILIEAQYLISEAGKMISASNHKKLADAIAAMQSAMETIAPLLAADADDVVESNNPLTETEIDPILKLAETKQYKWELVNLAEVAKILARADSYSAKHSAVSGALRKRAISEMITSKVSDGGNVGYEDYYDYGLMPCIHDLYDEQVVYSVSRKLYQCDYSISGDEVTLGDPTEVQVSYVPANSESSVIETDKDTNRLGELILLNERAVRGDGTVKVKLISPGWGSSGYYSEKMLQRDGPKVFKSGLHMYLNHQSESESRDRPEGDLRNLVGVLEEDATYDKKGPTGPGLYSTAKVFQDFKSFIDEAAPYIGVSIRAGGRGVEGEAEGRHGVLVDELTEGYSVDYVTLPGRGGQVLPLLEAARNRISTRLNGNNIVIDNITLTEVGKVETIMVDISEKELAELREAAANASTLTTTLAETNKQLARLHEKAIITEARTIVMSKLAGVQMLDITRNRVAQECLRNIPTKDGELDSEALVAMVTEAATNELKYLETTHINTTNGMVVGMGSTPPAVEELTDAAFEEGMNDAFRGIGLSEKSAKIAAGVR